MDFRQDSRFFMGKNKVMMLALGRTVENEYQDNLHQVSKRLRGQVREYFGRPSVFQPLFLVNLISVETNSLPNTSRVLQGTTGDV